MKPEKEIKTESQEYSLENNESIVSVLRKLPSLIKQKQDEILNVQMQKAELIRNNKTIEQDVSRGVASETIEGKDKEGQPEKKKKYTNELQRESAIKVRLINDLEYNKQRDAADKLDKWVSYAEIELSYLKRVNNNAGYLTLLGGVK